MLNILSLGNSLFQYSLFKEQPFWRSSVLWLAYKGVYKHTQNTDTLLLYRLDGVNATCATLLFHDNVHDSCQWSNCKRSREAGILSLQNLIARSDVRNAGYLALPPFYLGRCDPWYRIKLAILASVFLWVWERAGLFWRPPC